MEFGSVRFFKRLILTFLALILIIPTIISISLAYNNKKYKAQNKEYEEKLRILAEQVHKKITEEVIDKKDSRGGDKSSEPSFAYQKLYPNLYCEPASKETSPPKTMYITFDDGPSENTPLILDILKKNKIKATFFLINPTSPDAKKYMKQIVSEGHSIGIHTYSHDYRKIYSSVEAYLDDFNKMYNLVYETTGQKTTIFRFPGGSINSYNQQIYKQIIAEMVRRGFTYYDWNLCAEDSVRQIEKQEVVDNVLKDSPNVKAGILLMHDSRNKTSTVEALPLIIDGLKKQGFSFAPLTNKIKPIIFEYSE